MSTFSERLSLLEAQHKALVSRKNLPSADYNGIYQRYQHPVLTAAHVPVFWRFDLNPATNPLLLERQGINAVFNPGAMKWNGKYLLMTRTEGLDRKSFFAIAESPNGIDNFTFWDYPVQLPETEDPDTNVYDMRLTPHEDGWIYGVFCTERKDPNAPKGDLSSAVAQAGIVRTKDLLNWERLPDLKTPSAQQRNVVLHPEFVNGKYAFYTRPQDGFIDTRAYHTIKEVKNGQGPHPIKTPEGWLHLAHGVRNTAAGLRYVIYMFMTALEDPSKLIHSPAGHLIAPDGEERVGDVSNVTFTNGWIKDDDGTVFMYYASSDTRCHVAVSSVDRLIDYCKNTPPDTLRSAGSVARRTDLIRQNLEYMKKG